MITDNEHTQFIITDTLEIEKEEPAAILIETFREINRLMAKIYSNEKNNTSNIPN